jgi:hypothetical protein
VPRNSTVITGLRENLRFRSTTKGVWCIDGRNFRFIGMPRAFEGSRLTGLLSVIEELLNLRRVCESAGPRCELIHSGVAAAAGKASLANKDRLVYAMD